ncbi:MAG: FliO/MopB family protein [Magnetococcales bacterium]|nr:FliO/MopB family protein [Magnetococcales bacterium]
MRPLARESRPGLWTGVWVAMFWWGWSMGMACASAPSAGSEPLDLAGEAARIVGYLLLLMALGAIAVRVSRKYTPGMGGGGPIRIEDGRNFSPGVGVRLVRIGARAWLLGVSKDRVTVLAEMHPEDLPKIKNS